MSTIDREIDHLTVSCLLDLGSVAGVGYMSGGGGEFRAVRDGNGARITLVAVGRDIWMGDDLIRTHAGEDLCRYLYSRVSRIRSL